MNAFRKISSTNATHRRYRSLLAVSWFFVAVMVLGVGIGCQHPRRTPDETDQPGSPPTPPLEAHLTWADEVVYFVLIDRFADGNPHNNYDVDREGCGSFHGGDLQGLTERLDELADLGITAIWINPVVKNIDHYVDSVGFPDWGYHGYWADDFEALEPRFGTEADLRAFVDACHDRDIKVLLDVVYNHCGYGARYLSRPDADEWLRTDGPGNPCGQDDLTMCLLGLPDFKTENQATAQYLLNAHLGLARRVGLDGFRLDTVKHVGHAFWQTHRRRVNEELGEDFFLLGEVWGGDAQQLDPWFVNDELDAGFDFSFHGSAVAFALGHGRTVAFSHYLEQRHAIRPGYLLCHFLSSHDVPGALFDLQGDMALYKLCVALQFTSIGIPMAYYGEEVGRMGGEWPDNRRDMPWGDSDTLPGKGVERDEVLRAYFKRLIDLRKKHPALWRGDYQALHTADDLLIFQRNDQSGADTVIVAINRSQVTATADLLLPAAWQGRQVVEALNQDREVTPASAEMFTIQVPPVGAQIYRVLPDASTASDGGRDL